MEIRLLGPVEVELGGRPLKLGGPKQRAVLSLLAMNANVTVPVDRLIEGLWGEKQPASAAKMVQLYVSQLRKLLAGERGVELLTHGRGYELRLDPEAVDAARFERLVAEASRAHRNGGAGEAAHRALMLWRGPPLADLANEPFAIAEGRRLEELRLVALELAIESDLEAGHHRELIGRLESLVAEHPLRERLHDLRMLALYRAGRQAEALEAYSTARAALVEQIGVEPGPELRRLQEAILRQDPALELPARELPAELTHGSPTLAGRRAELDRLRAAWHDVQEGAGRVLLVTGARGIGKTRLVAELAGELHARGARVVYVGGATPERDAAAALEQARRTSGHGLLVIDDLDQASPEVLRSAAELAGGAGARSLLIVLVGRDDPPLTPFTRMARELAARGAERLALRPLEADAVREIVELYTEERAASAPVERLLEASGGLPQRIHEVAADWTRRETVKRVGARAGRAAARRGELRELEAELASTVVELHTVRDRAEHYSLPPRRQEPAGSDEDAIPICPFKGLASYDVSDADYFSGRERLVAEIVARLAGATLLGVVGPSGSGKSSVVRAGLLPALASGVLPGSEHWRPVVLRPGEHPMGALRRELGTEDGTDDPIAAALARLGPEARLLLAVDQFEETFAACHDERERAAFIDVLVDAAQQPAGRVVVVLALRADYYGACAAHPRLSRLLGASQVVVAPMQPDELAQAIEAPTHKAGLVIEPELVARLVSDVSGQAGGLPLLSTALLELWQHRQGRRMTLAAYERTGGVRGAVARLAERAYGTLSPDEQRAARRILLRLAGSGERDTVVRRRVPLDELEVDRDEQAARVLEALTTGRLVTVDEGTAEVAHEALLREWPRLRGWLEEDAEGRRLHRHITLAARDWDSAGRDPGELYRGARLAAALDWAATHEAELNTTERAFLDASRSASERSQRRLRAGLAGVASLLVLAVIAGLVAVNERGNARDEALAAAAQRLGAQALVEDDLDRSLLLARQGMAMDDSLQTRGNLLAALLKSPAAIGVLRGDGDRLISLDVSPDERTLAFIDHDGTLSFVDTRTRRPAGRPTTISGHAGVIIDAAVRLDHLQFSPDGSRLAVGGGEPVVLDARTHRELFPLRIRPERFIYSLRFSNDGRTLLAAVAVPPDFRPTIQRFDARSGRPLGPERQISDAGDVTLIATRSGRGLVTTVGEGPTIIRDAPTLRPLRRVPSGAEQVTLSPDDRTMLAGGGDGSVRFLDLVTGNVRRASGRHEGRLVEAVFSADGGTAISAGADGRLIVWDVRRSAAVETLSGHAGQVTGMAISRDGSTLYTAALDGRVLIWDLSGARRLGRPFKVGRDSEEHPRYALSPDGRVLAIGQLNGTVALFDARTLRALSKFPVVPKGPVRGMGYVPGGRLLVVGGDEGFLALVDPHRGKIVKRLPGHRDTVFTPSISADGRLMATASGFDTVRLYALPSGRPVGRPLRGPPGIGDVSLSPDGRTLAITRPPTGGVDIRDVPTLRRRTSLPEAETVWDLARFTPDGRYLVGGSYKGWARLWSTETWKPASRRFTGHAGRVEWQSMSPDGRTLATGGPDGTVRLWDLPTQQPLGAPLPGRTNRYLLPQFTPDGAHLFAIATGRAYRWDVRPASWARHACAVAGRKLTRSEWQDALPERDYDPAC
jgi:WD40 repeat protein/DNA-binding SARP family transcriptional activator/energy-coupling factor transporter ATP-binding protein EcfA2